MQADLCMTGVRAMTFNNPPLLTALANDYGYETVLEGLVRLWVDQGDLLIAISSSGQSENILRAAQASLAKVITFSGFRPDNPLRDMGYLNFYVPSWTYDDVEVAHSTLTHFLTNCVKKRSA